MNPDQRHHASGHSFALPNDLCSLDHPLHPTMNPTPLPSSVTHRATRPPNPSYNMRRRSVIPPQTSALPSHPDDNPGPWTRRSASWSRAEDERLAHLVRLEEANSPSNTPTKMWSRVAAQLTGRTGKQCRERWLNQLKPGIRRGSWTDEEERILHEAHAELGNKWVAIAQRLPGRTDNCVKNHWNSMLRKRQRREAALRSSYAAATRALPARIPSGNMLGQVNADLARRASTMAEDKKVMNPTAAYYQAMQNQNPAMYESMARSMMELPGLTSPITPQRNAKLQIANLVVPSKTGSTYESQSVAPRVGEKRPAPPLNYDSVSKRRSVLYPSAQMTLGARRMTVNRTLNPPTFNNQPDLGRTSHQAETVPPLNPYMSFAKPAEDTMPTYPFGPHYTAMSPVSTPVAGVPAAYPPLDQRLWLPSTYGVAERNMAKQVDPTVGTSDTSVKCTQSGTDFSTLEKMGSGKSETGKNGSKTPAGPGKQLHFLSVVASSVPPSPLTPESRFSSTSLSRASSPGPSGARTHATSPEGNALGMVSGSNFISAPTLAPHMHVPAGHTGQNVESGRTNSMSNLQRGQVQDMSAQGANGEQQQEHGRTS